MTGETQTISLAPHFNLKRIEAFAEAHQTRDPQSHLSGMLEVLSGLADFIDVNEEDITLGDLIVQIRSQHAAASQELLSWFGPEVP